MKAIFEFNLPEETAEFNAANNGSKMASAMRDIQQHIRSALKYQENSVDVVNALEAVRELIPYALLED